MAKVIKKAAGKEVVEIQSNEPAAIQPEVKQPKVNTDQLIVKQSFRDKYDFDKVYQVGENVNHLQAERLDNLKSLGIL